MKIDYRGGLLFVSMTLEYGANTLTVDNIILDTGAAQSWDRTAKQSNL